MLFRHVFTVDRPLELFHSDTTENTQTTFN
jgi:hypothetical protein